MTHADATLFLLTHTLHPRQAMSTTIFSKVDVSLNYLRINCKLLDTILCTAIELVMRYYNSAVR